jgi:hypothetical protein
MSYSRKELIKTEATMNQVRNAVFHLARLMEKTGIENSKDRFRKMGQNIAKTYIKYWKPTDVITLGNLKDVITTIYQKVLNSTVSIEINEAENKIKVRDHNCALCKYHYKDVEIAGCEILLGLVSELINLINKEYDGGSTLLLQAYEVIESRAYGDKSCIQTFNYKFEKEG